MKSEHHGRLLHPGKRKGSPTAFEGQLAQSQGDTGHPDADVGSVGFKATAPNDTQSRAALRRSTTNNLSEAMTLFPWLLPRHDEKAKEGANWRRLGDTPKCQLSALFWFSYSCPSILAKERIPSNRVSRKTDGPQLVC